MVLRVEIGCLYCYWLIVFACFFTGDVFEGLEELAEDLLQLELSSEEVCEWVWFAVYGLEGVV